MLVPQAVVPVVLRLQRANRSFVSAEGAQAHLAHRVAHPQPYDPPRRLQRRVLVDVDRSGPWPVVTLTPKQGQPRGAVVYLHGGAWVNEIVPQHWDLAAQVAHDAGTTVIVPIYPLVPAGTAGPVVDAVAQLARTAREKHERVCLAGDSAGGQIALSTALQLRDADQVAVARTLLIAPVLDLSLSNPDIDAVQRTDPWLGRDGLRAFGDLWRGDLPLAHPSVSPLAADLTGLGPISLWCGSRDILTPDARLLTRKAAKAGVDVELHEQPGAVHVYPLTPTRQGRSARTLLIEQATNALRPST